MKEDINNSKENINLRKFAELKRGVTFSSDDLVENNGYKILRANNLNLDGTLNFENIMEISKKLQINEGKKLKRNDIFICLASGSQSHIGKVSFINSDIDAYIGGFMGIIRSKDQKNLTSKYLYYILKDVQFNNYINKEITSVNINNLSAKILLNFEINLPVIESQSIITNYLDKKCGEIEELIKIQEQEIEKLEQYKKSIIYEAVTKGLDPKAKMKDSGIEWVGEIPEDWDIQRLKYLGKFRSGLANKKGEDFGFGYPFLNYKNVYKNFSIDINSIELVNSTEDDRKKYDIKRGDVFFTGSSETIEELGLSSVAINDWKEAVFNGFCIRFRPYNQKLLLPEFSKYLFRSKVTRTYLTMHDNSVTRTNLSQETLKNMLVCLPKDKEQEKISNFLDNKCGEIDDLISKKQVKIDKLEEYKKSLIYECVTGKREV